MKKTIYTFVFAGLSSLSFAQTIPNAGFENWTSGLPDMWNTEATFSGVSQSTDKQAGNFAAKVVPSSFGIGYLSLNDGNNYPTGGSNKPMYLNGYIKSNIQTGDSLYAIVEFSSGSSSQSGGALYLSTTSKSSWTAFNVPLSYPASLTPDSFSISFFMTGSSNSNFIIDQLSFGNTPAGSAFGTSLSTGVKNIQDEAVYGMKISPNPAQSQAQLAFTLPIRSNVSVRVFDISGRQVSTIVENSTLKGLQELNINTSALNSGVYFVQIVTNNRIYTQKLLVNNN